MNFQLHNNGNIGNRLSPNLTKSEKVFWVKKSSRGDKSEIPNKNILILLHTTGPILIKLAKFCLNEGSYPYTRGDNEFVVVTFDFRSFRNLRALGCIPIVLQILFKFLYYQELPLG